MNKIYKLTLAVFFSALLTVTANAGTIGFGATASGGSVHTNGSEVIARDANDAAGQANPSGGATGRHEEINLASFFVEYIFDNGAAIGIDHVPGEASLGSKTTTRTPSADAGTTTVTQKAAAEVRDMNMVYLEAPVVGPIFVTAGLASVDVNTQETLGTGAAYANVSVLGYMAGVGLKMNLGDHFYIKASGTYTDFEEINLVATGTTNVIHINADVDIAQAKAAIGYKF